MTTATNNVTAAAEAAFDAATKATHQVTQLAAKTAEAWTPANEAAEKLQETGQELVYKTKAYTGLTIDAYERGVANLVEWQTKVAEIANVDWFTELTNRTTSALTELTGVYAGTARELIK